MKALFVRRARGPRGKALIALALFTALVFSLAQLPFLCEYLFARGVTRFLSGVLGALSGALSVSLYECTAVLLLLGVPALAAALIALLCKKRFAAAGLLARRIAAAALSVLLAFGVLYAPLYGRASCFSALGLKDASVTEEEVYAAAEYFLAALNDTAALVERDGEGNALQPYSFDTLADKVNAAFDALPAGYYARFSVRPKEVALSVPMSYLGITGIYFPFYAEANVNVNIPASELPVTLAHETAHAKGVAHETEANVTAYVLCIRSDDAYIRYSGLMRAVSSLLNALPEEQFDTLYAALDPCVAQEYRSVSAHYARYEGAVDKISSFFNDIFLKANGVQGGTASYGMTARGLVALWRSETGK